MIEILGRAARSSGGELAHRIVESRNSRTRSLRLGQPVLAPFRLVRNEWRGRHRIESPIFFVFSDDLTWCRDQLSMADLQFVDANGPDDAAAELQLMAICHHHILANSSLSWWAAWLGDRL